MITFEFVKLVGDERFGTDNYLLVPICCSSVELFPNMQNDIQGNVFVGTVTGVFNIDWVYLPQFHYKGLETRLSSLQNSFVHNTNSTEYDVETYPVIQVDVIADKITGSTSTNNRTFVIGYLIKPKYGKQILD